MKKEIYFAGGCFWGMEAYFSRVKGVVETKVGYANGNIKNPSYEEVCKGIATHSECVKIIYNDKITNLDILLNHYFRVVNPYSVNKQGNDEGLQYRSGIYYLDVDSKSIIINYINNLQTHSNKKIVVEVLPLNNFYDAEIYHQKYLDKNPNGYCHIDLSLLKEEEK